MKKFLTIAMILCAAVVAKADLMLYWTVPADAWDGAQYAALMGKTADGYVQLGYKTEIGSEADTNIGVSNSYVDYLINLYTREDNVWSLVAYSSSVYTFKDLTDSGSTYEDRGAMSEFAANPYSFSGFTAAIPEPTSAMMLLLGLAGLALKRKSV